MCRLNSKWNSGFWMLLYESPPCCDCWYILYRLKWLWMTVPDQFCKVNEYGWLGIKAQFWISPNLDSCMNPCICVLNFASPHSHAYKGANLFILCSPRRTVKSFIEADGTVMGRRGDLCRLEYPRVRHMNLQTFSGFVLKNCLLAFTSLPLDMCSAVREALF